MDRNKERDSYRRQERRRYALKFTVLSLRQQLNTVLCKVINIAVVGLIFHSSLFTSGCYLAALVKSRKRMAELVTYSISSVSLDKNTQQSLFLPFVTF